MPRTPTYPSGKDAQFISYITPCSSITWFYLKKRCVLHILNTFSLSDYTLHECLASDPKRSFWVANDSIFKTCFDQKVAQAHNCTFPETSSKSTWKWMVGRRSFPFGMGYFQGELLVSGRVGAESLLPVASSPVFWMFLVLVSNTRHLSHQAVVKLEALYPRGISPVKIGFQHFPVMPNTFFSERKTEDIRTLLLLLPPLPSPLLHLPPPLPLLLAETQI